MRPWTLLAATAATLAAALFAGAQRTPVERTPYGLSLLWPEEQRAFLQDGPGLLLTPDQLAELLDLDTVGRERFIVDYLARDPLPETPENELQEGIRRRRDLVASELLTFLDDRAKILFLHGVPAERVVVDCAETYRPLEIWSYPVGGVLRRLVLYRPDPGVPYKLWLPVDSKRVLYNPEMEYWLEQWEEMRRQIIGGRRFDRTICKQSKEVDAVTGVDGLFNFQPDRPKNDEIRHFLQPPDDLAAWAAKAAAQAAPEVPSLGDAELEVFFPQRAGLRMVSRAMVVLPPDAGLEPFVDGEKTELRVTVEGLLEHGGRLFDSFRVRYMLPPPDGAPVALVLDRELRPGEDFLLRLRVVDEVSGRQLRLNKGFTVAREAKPEGPPPAGADSMVTVLGEEIQKMGIPGYDSLVLVPPESDVVFGLWRAEALVTGERIGKVVFYLDDKEVLSRNRPPFTAELRLSPFPTEQLVRAEGFDGDGTLVASDEVVLNQPRGELRVRILDPPRGIKASGPVAARAEVVVPEEKRVEFVEFAVNDEVVARVEKPPWEATVEVPPGSELVYLTVTAQLDDGNRAEDVRFLNAPDYMDQVDVNLIELYTTVVDRSGRLVRGLTADDFEVYEDGRRQKIAKFELVDNLPLTLGIAIDTSGSMFESLAEAQRAAIGFLENIITPRDRCFALAFADRPMLLMERTSDVGAVAERLEDLIAEGSTSLHDAIVTSLYYYRGIRGRRALVLLSDGEDTSSTLGFSEALEYAKRSGVAVYTIGLRIGKAEIGVRRKLEALAEETGGRTFYIKESSELANTYGEIEAELRSQYLVAYNSDRPGGSGEYREVTVKVEGGKQKARTIRGYYS